MEKKEKLIEALEKERDAFKRRGQDTTEHDVAIEFLKTGVLPKSLESFDLLDAAMYDFETLYKDYCK